MGLGVQLIVLNSDEEFRKELRASSMQVDGVKIVAEVEEPALLRQAVGQFPADILLVNLDPNPDAVLPLAGEIASSESDLAVFAVSASTDSQLILKAMRMGLREFLPRPIESQSLQEAVERSCSNRVQTKHRGKLITVHGCSGGIGATMLATNLAVEFAHLAEGKVTIVDLDYRYGQVATLLDVEATYTLADLCQSPEALEAQVISRTLVTHSSGVQVLSRPLAFSQADTITASACVGLLSTLLELNEYVVADGPTRFDVGGQAIADFSDVHILMTQLLVPSVRNAMRTIETLKEHGTNMERVKLVCNRLGRESGHLSLKDVTETLGLKVFGSIPDDWITVSGAINLGEPLMTHSPKSKVRQVIQEMAERLHGPHEEADDTEEPAKGLIGRIFAGS